MKASDKQALLFAALLFSAFIGWQQHERSRYLHTVVLDMRQRISWFMKPLIERDARQPHISSLAGEVCGSNDCEPELQGWNWALQNRVSHQSDCYGPGRLDNKDSSMGCEIYVKVMHLNKMTID
jgi:hypothetical protein